MNKATLRSLLLCLVSLSSAAAFADMPTFLGEVSATPNAESYDFVRTEIAGGAAEALFNVVTAMGRIETVNDHLRRVRGSDLTCFEHFGQTPVEERIYYTCEFIVAQGGHVKREP